MINTIYVSANTNHQRPTNKFLNNNTPNRLYNLLYQKQFWVILKQVRQRIIMMLPGKYHKELLNEGHVKSTFKGRNYNVANIIMNNRLNLSKIVPPVQNRGIHIISSSRPFRCNFFLDSLQEEKGQEMKQALHGGILKDYQLASNFIYYTLLQRIVVEKNYYKQHYLMEVFFVDFDPKSSVKKKSLRALGSNTKSINETTETDSYKVVQLLAANNDNSSFISTNMPGYPYNIL